MMMRTGCLAIVSALAIAFVAAACGNDDGGPVTGDGGVGRDADMPCTPIAPTYANVYTQILAADTCVSDACHDSVMPGGALDLSLAKEVVLMGLLNDPVDAEDVQAMFTRRVVPNDLQASWLWRKVADEDPPGFTSRMPLGCSPRFPQSCLTQCELDAMSGWIMNGAMDD